MMATSKTSMLARVVGPLLLVLVLAVPARAFDIDLKLVGYSFLPVASGAIGPDGLILQLQDGSVRRVDLTYSFLLGTDGTITKPCIIHQHWLRMTYAGDRGSLICTSLPILLVIGVCAFLDALFLLRYFKRRRTKNEAEASP